MPLVLNCHIMPKELGAGVNDNGNVEIFGIDKDSGAIVTIEIHSASFKRVMEQLGRLRGVGIVKAGRAQIEVVEENPTLEVDLGGGKGNGS